MRPLPNKRTYFTSTPLIQRNSIINISPYWLEWTMYPIGMLIVHDYPSIYVHGNGYEHDKGNGNASYHKSGSVYLGNYFDDIGYHYYGTFGHIRHPHAMLRK